MQYGIIGIDSQSLEGALMYCFVWIKCLKLPFKGYIKLGCFNNKNLEADHRGSVYSLLA